MRATGAQPLVAEQRACPAVGCSPPAREYIRNAEDALAPIDDGVAASHEQDCASHREHCEKVVVMRYGHNVVFRGGQPGRRGLVGIQRQVRLIGGVVQELSWGDRPESAHRGVLD